MVWSTPITFLSNTPLAAADLNAMLRDNMLEQAPAKAQQAGGYFAATGANGLAERQVRRAAAAGQVTSTSSTFAFKSDGPKVVVTHGGSMLVLFCSRIQIQSGSGIGSVAPGISGTVSADLSYAVRHPGDNADLARMGGHQWITGLTPGTDTVQLAYATSGGTAAFTQREIIAIPF